MGGVGSDGVKHQQKMCYLVSTVRLASSSLVPCPAHVEPPIVKVIGVPVRDGLISSVSFPPAPIALSLPPLSPVSPAAAEDTVVLGAFLRLLAFPLALPAQVDVRPRLSHCKSKRRKKKVRESCAGSLERSQNEKHTNGLCRSRTTTWKSPSLLVPVCVVSRSGNRYEYMF